MAQDPNEETIEGQPPPYKAPQGNDEIFTEEILLSSSWTLHYSPIRHKREMRFHAKGVIGVGKNEWENSWKFIKEGVFAVFTASGDPDVIFKAIKADDGRWYLS